ncbi:hypothetical protein [Streptomyces sp. NBC_00059]|uniref:hypothetical protein n=1 Tax=Streptomyces sp. NBC_00059 TaxID=2975635 RepID=UPI0022514F62|nr:hypothetical protein [Streptomyces sp. NBC_00059]MCX5411266.1 hypothetical protein [Streptomyces sp. NBC_00059]
MTLLRFNGVFDSIGARIAEFDSGKAVSFEALGSRGAVRISLRDARAALYGTERDEVLRDSIWRWAVECAQRDKTPEGLDRLLLLWLAVPGLYRTIRRVSSRLHIDRKDLEAEALLALLETLDAVDPNTSGLGRSLVGAACNRVWALARLSAAETSVADVASVAKGQGACPLFGPETEPDPSAESWELRIHPPARPDGLAAAIRFTVPSTEVHNEWLGDLAVRIGLQDIVHRARRPGEGARIGTLSLRRAGDGR